MPFGRRILVLLSLVTPLLFSGSVMAAAEPESPGSVVQELHVKAEVLEHRDIILDNRGQILRIISNTLQDVTPVVYVSDTIPENQRPLTDELYQQYRRLVPEGTAKYGTLYEARVTLTTAPSNLSPRDTKITTFSLAKPLQAASLANILTTQNASFGS